MEKRTILALTLSLVVLVSFQFIFATKRPLNSPLQVAASTEVSAKDQGVTFIKKEEENKKIQELSLKEEETVIHAGIAEINFTNIGGNIKEVRLKGFGGNSESEMFINETVYDKQPFALQSESLPGLESAIYKPFRTTYGVEYTYEKPGIIKIVKSYSVKDDTGFMNCDIKIENLSDREINFSYQLAGPSGISANGDATEINYIEAAAFINSEMVKKNSVKGIFMEKGDIGWIGIKSRYFAAILTPFNNPQAAFITGNRSQGLSTYIKSRNMVISPNTASSDGYLLYVGPQNEKILASAGHDMELIIDYGWFGFISKFFLSTLRVFHSFVKSWGVSIILLTMIINICTYPLTKKSFVSMHKMKNIQPHMQKLRELHKDNPQKLNKEMMELYKKYKVNPFGGCLPILLQIPIFIALYQGLMKSIELKGSAFLWIKDLARPDAAKLPFTLPFLGNHINILPIIMSIMMVIQQRISSSVQGAMTPEQASQQKIMVIMMPLLFGFLFYAMPSGLVLYWLTNTLLMSAEQMFLNKRLAVST